MTPVERITLLFQKHVQNRYAAFGYGTNWDNSFHGRCLDTTTVIPHILKFYPSLTYDQVFWHIYTNIYWVNGLPRGKRAAAREIAKLIKQ